MTKPVCSRTSIAVLAIALVVVLAGAAPVGANHSFSVTGQVVGGDLTNGTYLDVQTGIGPGLTLYVVTCGSGLSGPRGACASAAFAAQIGTVTVTASGPVVKQSGGPGALTQSVRFRAESLIVQ